MSLAMHLGDLLLRVICAVLLGGLLGWERERREKPAGVRTHMLVSLGAACFMELVVRLDDKGPDIDPTRVIQGIVGGIGFLCAGSIIQSRGHVQGITTAASVWVAGGIGTACGLGNYATAVAATLISFIVLRIVPQFSGHETGIAEANAPPASSGAKHVGSRYTRFHLRRKVGVTRFTRTQPSADRRYHW